MPASGMPHLLRHLDAARELFPLVVLGELIAVGGGGEAALVAEGALLQRHVARGLVDALSQIVPAFHRRPLGAHEAEHNALTLRHEEQRRAVAGPLVETGRGSCRERVCKIVFYTVLADPLKKK